VINGRSRGGLGVVPSLAFDDDLPSSPKEKNGGGNENPALLLPG
jgi:hypothetical protein